VICARAARSLTRAARLPQELARHYGRDLSLAPVSPAPDGQPHAQPLGGEAPAPDGAVGAPRAAHSAAQAAQQVAWPLGAAPPPPGADQDPRNELARAGAQRRALEERLAMLALDAVSPAAPATASRAGPANTEAAQLEKQLQPYQVCARARGFAQQPFRA